MKIAYITAGAAGMYCGSCMHDNTLVAALQAQGEDALLIPTYTPITVDEPDVSQRRVFFGGINVYLQQKLALFRHTPWLLDRLWDAPRLLRWVSRFAVRTRAEDLGDLTISMLKGEHGHQKKEIDKVVDWLEHEVRPQIIVLTNVILSGMVEELKRRLNVPVIGTLQGDDIFLEALPEPFRGQALTLISQHCQRIDGFIATCGYYADFMAGYLGIPRERIHVVYPGINLAGHGPAVERNGPPFTIGYFARVCPEKGFHHLVEAFRQLRQLPGTPPVRLRVSGWLGDNQRRYFDDQVAKLPADAIEHVPSPDHAGKVRFLQSLDVLSVPTVYHEPKGLYVLEAWANGVPVVQPRHGSFPELIDATGAGLLVNPEDPHDLAKALRRLLDQPKLRQEMARKGREAVLERFTARSMAEKTLTVFRQYVGEATNPER
jgi:glycosyltransferase involved in cell wall biosynthesis